MPEDQKPFVHQNGTSTPPGPTPAGTLLHATALATLIEAFETDVAIMRDLALPSLNEDLRIRRRAIETVQLLQEPRVKAVRPSPACASRCPSIRRGASRLMAWRRS